jgi:hypothetical protein
VTLIKIKLKDFNEASKVLKKDYYNELEKIIKYFIILKKFKDISKSVFRTFLKNVLKYIIIKN